MEGRMCRRMATGGSRAAGECGQGIQAEGKALAAGKKGVMCRSLLGELEGNGERESCEVKEA